MNIGRNEACSCGSGLKYKKCCINKRQESLVRELNYSKELEIIWTIQSDRFDPELKKNIISDPKLLQHHTVLAQVGQDLGSIGFLEEAIHFQRKALKLKMNDNVYKLNLAATLSNAKNHTEALELVEQVPDKFPRKYVINGNIIRELKGPEAAVPYYEKAIKQEPDFYLPYASLIHCNQEHPESKRYWIERSFKKFPKNPEIVVNWIQMQLGHSRYYDELIEKNWHSNLSTEIDKSVIDNDVAIPKSLDFLHRFHSVIQAFSSKNKTNFSEICLNFGPIFDSVECSVYLFLIETSIKLGLVNITEHSFNKLCPTCSKPHSLDELKFLALKNSDYPLEAIDFGKELLDRPLKNQMIIADYLSLLDDHGRTKDAIEQVIEITKKHPLTNVFAEARIFYDLAFYAACIGTWGTVIYALEEFEKLDKLELLSIDEYFVEPINLSLPNRILAYTGNKQFNTAKDLMSILENQDGIIIGGKRLVIGEDLTTHIYEDLTSILSFALSISMEDEYLNKFSKKLKGTFFENWTGSVSSVYLKEKLSSLLAPVHPDDISKNIAKSIAAFKEKTSEEHDYSDILNGIEMSISSSRTLDEEILRCFIDADQKYFGLIKPHDFSPLITSYCKGLELYIRKHIFLQFKDKLSKNIDFKEIIDQASSDKKVGQFRSLLLFIKNDRIELGSMAQVLKLSNGRSSERVRLLSEIKKFFDLHYPALCSPETIEELSSLANNFRNMAVHEKGFDEDAAQIVREKVYQIINSNMRLRLV